MQEFEKLDGESFEISGLAVPNYENVPTQFLEFVPVSRISGDIARQLGPPVQGVGLWHAGIDAGCYGMQVPEAAMHEDDLTTGDEHQVRFSG